MIGYARVSTQDQNLDLQRSALQQAGCERIYEDKISGTRTERQGLAMYVPEAPHLARLSRYGQAWSHADTQPHSKNLQRHRKTGMR